LNCSQNLCHNLQSFFVETVQTEGVREFCQCKSGTSSIVGLCRWRGKWRVPICLCPGPIGGCNSGPGWFLSKL